MFRRTNFIMVIYFVFQALSEESKNLLIHYFIRTRRLFRRPQKRFLRNPQLRPFSIDQFTFECNVIIKGIMLEKKY